MLRLKAFGQPLVERDGTPLGGAARQRRVIALLTVIAAGRARGVSRDRVLGLLWAEREPEKARQALTQSLYHARRALSQDDVFFAAADLRLNPDVISSDLDDFGTALERGDLAGAVALYHGPFLDGFHLNDAPEFERWMSEERADFHTRCARALEQLATEAAAARNLSASAERWKQLAALEPLNSRIAMEAMRAMAQAGDRAGAVRYAEIHSTLLREQLDLAPHPAIAALANELRAQPVWVPEAGIAQTDDEPRQVRAAQTDADSIAPSPLSPPSRQRWLRRAAIAAASVTLVVVVVIVTRLTRSRDQARAPADLIVVAPFRASGADPSLAYLREGLVDLLVTSLGDDRTAIADPGAVLNAWRQAGSTDGGDLTRARALEVARGLGATRLLTGSVVGGPSRLVVNAAIVNVPGGGVRAQATENGPVDSLTTIIDRLVARLLVKEAGEGDRLASHTSSSPQALREYLHGQAAYRRGSYDEAVRWFRRALERDASFAMAGLALATAAERIDATEERARGLAAAWLARTDLTARDSIYLRALVGPRYPEPSTPREFLRAWERAAAVLGDRADVWHELGERLFYDGQALGLRDWRARATAAFRRAADLDPAFASPRQYLMQLGAVAGDTGEVRLATTAYQRLDSTGEIAPFVRWRSAQALADRSALAELRRRIPRMPAASLRSIALSSQYNAIELGDADRAISALMSRAARGDDRADALLARHALALNRGRTAAALDAVQALAEDRSRAAFATRLEVTDFLYGRGDSTAAARAAERLTRLLESSSHRVLPPGQSAEVASNACVVRQWRLWSHATAPLDSAMTLLLRGAASRDSSAGELCTALADAIEATGARTPDASQRAAHLDSLVQSGARDDELASYVGLALARAYVALGDNRRALDAVRRRPYMRRWPHYLAAHLELEGKVAEAIGDSAGAADAYARYLTLRSDPDAAFRGEVADVRAALARLSERPDSSR